MFGWQNVDVDASVRKHKNMFGMAMLQKSVFRVRVSGPNENSPALQCWEHGNSSI